MKNLNFTVYIERDEDGIFIGSIPTIPSCYAQGKTQEEMLKNLREVLCLCLRNNNKNTLENTKFVGIQNLEVAYA
ncbi:MAG: type II toxin-antitoxin system HicB family antitoxin [Candidatus Komeilibacteria bacterium]|nr:type II toxin-antitoxin system HicB family antitoxin [Candidatus Komeilibacteria bacterium]